MYKILMETTLTAFFNQIKYKKYLVNLINKVQIYNMDHRNNQQNYHLQQVEGMHIILWALFNLINVLIRQMLNKNKNSSFLKQVVVGGIGGAVLKYDMKTSVFIGVVAYVEYTNFFDSKGGGRGGSGGSVGTYNELHRNQ